MLVSLIDNRAAIVDFFTLSPSITANAAASPAVPSDPLLSAPIPAGTGKTLLPQPPAITPTPATASPHAAAPDNKPPGIDAILAAIGVMMVGMTAIAWQVTKESVRDIRTARGEVMELHAELNMKAVRHEALVDTHVRYTDAAAQPSDQRRQNESVALRYILNLVRADDADAVCTWLDTLREAPLLHPHVSPSVRAYIDSLAEGFPGNQDIARAARAVKAAVGW